MMYIHVYQKDNMTVATQLMKFNIVIVEKLDFMSDRVSRPDVINLLKDNPDARFLIFNPNTPNINKYVVDLLRVIDRDNSVAQVDSDNELLVIDMAQTQQTYTMEQILIN